jgi:hypothetical protein
MAESILNFGSYEVWLDPGFLINSFTLGTSTLGGTDVLDGNIDYYDVTEHVISVNISRGRQNARDSIETGNASITIYDDNGDFTVVNTNSIYWNPDDDALGFQPTRRVRIVRNGELLFSGQIVEYQQEITLSNQSFVTIRASDDLLRLQQSNINAHTPSEQMSNQRVEAILDRAEVNLFTGAGERVIANGKAPLGAYPIEQSISVRDYFNRVQTSEQGRIFIDRSGNFNFQRRAGRAKLNSPIAFSDKQDGDIAYSSFQLRYQ